MVDGLLNGLTFNNASQKGETMNTYTRQMTPIILSVVW